MNESKYNPENLTEMHRPIIRAWFDTVINPLITILKDEIKILSEDNLGYDIYQQTLKFTTSISKYFNYNYNNNFNQFLKAYYYLSGDFETHDNYIIELTNIYTTLYGSLTSDHKISILFSKIGLDEEYQKYFVRDLLNGISNQKDNFVKSELYNEHYRAMKQILDNYTKETEQISNIIKLLTNLDKVLIEKLENIENDLSWKTGTPLETSGSYAY